MRMYKSRKCAKMSMIGAVAPGQQRPPTVGQVQNQRTGSLAIMEQQITRARRQFKLLALMSILLCNRLSIGWHSLGSNSATGLAIWAEAVSVQRLNVPDLVVIDQLNQAQHQARSSDLHRPFNATSMTHSGNNLNSNLNQPEAASLINSLDQSAREQQPQFTFECLISFDKRKDKNLIVKWHHDERNEPIYQWIPELNKRSIAPQYRSYIAPIVTSSSQQHASSAVLSHNLDLSQSSAGQNVSSNVNPNQIQLLEAGFRLVRPSKELGGKYTCSAISSQNDDSKSKKMVVYTPPRSFRFNASRTDIGALLASQRDRLIQLTQPASLGPFLSSSTSSNQLPLAYRMKGFENLPNPTTISPQMYSTIDYVNVNQQRARQSPWLTSSPTVSPQNSRFSFDPTKQQSGSQPNLLPSNRQNKQQQNGVKLVCDIDQVFPVPEVSIYRIAKLDGSHPDKLAKLDTKIERDLHTGLFHVQVTSILDDDELQMKYGLNEPVYFECLIALTNLELSKYADNKRSIIYRPGSVANSLQGSQTSEDIKFEQVGNAATSTTAPIFTHLLPGLISLAIFIFGQCRPYHPGRYSVELFG